MQGCCFHGKSIYTIPIFSIQSGDTAFEVSERSKISVLKKQFKIITHTGFAAPATMLVMSTSMVKSRMILEYRDDFIELKNSPKTVMDIMLLNIRPGDYFNIKADGIDEYEVLQSIEISLSNLGLECL
jgi:phosphocarrier protein